jgi:hypothetical protein
VADDPDLRQRFEREAKTISSLNHPHICTLYDIGSQDGIDFLVMEYLEGDVGLAYFEAVGGAMRGLTRVRGVPLIEAAVEVEAAARPVPRRVSAHSEAPPVGWLCPRR